MLVWCSHRGISLGAVHLPGQDNTIADALSHPHQPSSSGGTVRGSSVDWCLDSRVGKLLFHRRVRPHVGLLAAKENHQLPAYFARGRDQEAMGADVLAQSWADVIGYVFPAYSPQPQGTEQGGSDRWGFSPPGGPIVAAAAEVCDSHRPTRGGAGIVTRATRPPCRPGPPHGDPVTHNSVSPFDCLDLFQQSC